MDSALLRINNISGHMTRSCPMRREFGGQQFQQQGTAWSLINSGPCVGRASPIKVLVTGAAGQIAYSLIFMIASGQMFGPYQPIQLHLLDIPKMADALKGVSMEIQDGAYPLVHSVLCSTDVQSAFTGVHVALLVGAFPRGPGMQRKDLLKVNVSIFKEQGEALGKYASRDVKVLVVGNPANTNALVALTKASELPPQNFSALTRLDQNRAASMVSDKVGVNVDNVSNVIIWGNHSLTQVPDVTHAIINNYPAAGLTSPALSTINDDKWVSESFMPLVQNRGAAVIAARKLSSAASAANAIVGHMRDWLMGTKQGEIVSMAVISDGSYNVPKGLIFSFPVTCRNGEWSIVQGLKISQSIQQKIDITTKELQEEKETAFSFL
ncbi:hypothetical protein CYY_004299 [Polysphondylium violaceum]|uniref:Malate dehydrogenase n=1 Tax=Polysphondylium violaceum TaxID=133409 RepID=A0A8J4PTJ4_9MYCE|nr:hypothetical protein CYY_004299 [Polysphondylium violaceum]